MKKDIPTVETENLQCPEDDEVDDDAVADAHAHAQERKQNHPQRAAEPTHMLLSPEQRRRKSLLAVILVLVIAVVVIIYVVVVIFRPNLKSAESPQQQPLETTTTVTPNCPPPSTKSIDKQFLLTGLFQRSGCHRMECLSDHTTTLHNTNTNTRNRLSHNAPLCQGQALCNQDDEKFPGVLFQFGVTQNGALVWQKCDPLDPSQTEIITLWEASEEHHRELPTKTTNTTAPPSSAVVDPSQHHQLWFEMKPDATWQILSTTGHEKNFTTITTKTSSTTATATQLVFEQLVQHQSRAVRVTPKCLNDRPVMDCPYLHFRRHGDIVMNYIDKQDGWVACKSRKICYSSLWE